jgi:hypothetical protein
MRSIKILLNICLFSVAGSGFIGLFQGCGVSDKATSESAHFDYGPQIAVPDGIYLVGTIPPGETLPARTVCASDNSRPVLSSAAASTANLVQLTKFGDLTADSMTVTIKGSSIVKVWTRTATLSSIFPGANTAFPSGSASCTATWTGTIATNLDGIFQENGSYEVTFLPGACEFEVHNYGTSGGSVATGGWIPNRYFTTPFVTTASATIQNGWDVTSSGTVYALTTPSSVANAQIQYSCTDGSKAVKMVLTKQ